MIAAREKVGVRANPGGRGPAPTARLTPCANLPVAAHHRTAVEARERRRLAELAGVLRAGEPGLDETGAFGAAVAPGLGPWPCLVMEDHSWISLFDRTGDLAYTYRAMLLAGDGDLVAIGVDRCPAFERYCREVLRLGRPEILSPGAAGHGRKPLAVRCAEDGRFVARVAETARAVGGLNLVPYMGTGGVWALAGRIAAAAGVPVRVAAPPPRLTRRVNDKAWFAARVGQVLGPRAGPPAVAAHNLAALAGQVAALAARYPSVAVKLVDSASSAGNIVLEPASIRGARLGVLRERLRGLLRRAGWQGGYPLMVTAWERPILASPSAQLWVPLAGDGGPVVEGLFDQAVAGPAAVFTGAAPTAVSPAWRRRIAHEAARLAALFQELGYFGRCSFDAILVGDDPEGAELHWVECNGRWGGVSIPMTLANRLLGDWARRVPVIAERADLSGPRGDFTAFLAGLAGELYEPDVRPFGAVVISPGRVEAGTGFELMVLHETLAASRAHAEALAARLAPPAP